MVLPRGGIRADGIGRAACERDPWYSTGREGQAACESQSEVPRIVRQPRLPPFDKVISRSKQFRRGMSHPRVRFGFVGPIPEALVTAIEVIQSALKSSQGMINSYLGDLSDEDIVVHPVAGANNIAWQIGH